MDTIQTALKLMRPRLLYGIGRPQRRLLCCPYSKAKEDRKYLKFEWKGSYFQYTCLPNGLACAPRLFTKILKPVYSHIRSFGHICMGHIDDSFLVGYDYTACNNNVKVTVDTFLKLGFVIHPEKSVFIPTQEIEFLGFLLNSVSMTIRLPPAKAERVRLEVAQVIGLIVSCQNLDPS